MYIKIKYKELFVLNKGETANVNKNMVSSKNIKRNVMQW